jgi:hypothetical protein
MRLGRLNTSLILDEVQEYMNVDKHVLLQKSIDPVYDIPYTNSLFEKYQMYSSRIMCLRPKTCYTVHRDQTPRIHFPIITDKRCLFILEDHAFYMEKGWAHYVDTTKSHSALNGTMDLFRYHIVGKTDEIL